ncbi:amidohydrolase family protein [Actinophytocola xinjiangensis]|nr:amidohydrolase family protein [Actinophytocola xinjiangensis]
MSEIMTRRGLLVAGAVLATTAAVPASRTAAATTMTALTGVNVVDVTGGPTRRGVTVLIDGERIVAVGRVAIPSSATVLDLHGKYVIPGLCDAHVHSLPIEAVTPPLYLANGITTVREMSGSPLAHEWRDRVRRGALLGPRSVIASRIIDGVTGSPESAVIVETEAQAEAAVRDAVREGADLVKVYSNLPADLYRVIAGEARRLRIPFAGHLPDRVPLTDASTAGQRSVEHLYGTWYATSTRERELRARIADGALGTDLLTWMRETHRLEWAAFTSHSPTKAATVLSGLARRGTAVVPTLSVYRVLDRPDDVDLTDDRLRYVPKSVVEGWRWALENIVKAGRTPRETAQRHAMLDHRLAFVGELARAGVPVVAGTDGGDLPFVLPAFGLHEELALLVLAGLSPLRALASATVESARLLDLDRDLGTVAPGKLADLVVLDADPLTDIRHTTRVHTVLAGGRVLSPADRAALLAAVAAH